MLKFKMNITDRKLLVKRVSELTGAKARYTYVPRCAYEIGDYTVEKNGDLVVAEDKVNNTFIQILQNEGMIGEAENTDTPCQPVVINTPSPRQAVEVPPLETVVEVVSIEDSDDEEEENDTVVPRWMNRLNMNVVDGSQQEVEERMEEQAESEAEDAMAEEAEPAAGMHPADEVAEAQNETAAFPAEEDAASAEESPAPEQLMDIPVEASECAAFPLDVTISLPLTRHTGTTLKNLINLLYSRGALVSKAVGGEFLIDENVVDALEEANPIKVEDVRTCLADYEDGILGFRLEEDKLTFDGFTNVQDAEHLQTYTKLATLMNKMALSQKRIQAKEVDSSNEKYALRSWLIRLGMSGDEYKADRKRLMENLSGHTAFRTEESQEKAKRKAQRQKEQYQQEQTAG